MTERELARYVERAIQEALEKERERLASLIRMTLRREEDRVESPTHYTLTVLADAIRYGKETL